MKAYINKIKENENVDSSFLVKEKSSGVTKTGNAYLKLKLGDSTGEIEGRIWTSVENFISGDSTFMARICQFEEEKASRNVIQDLSSCRHGLQ